jgi:hypothetical protein
VAWLDDLYITPGLCHFRVYVQYYRIVVAHDDVGAEIDGEEVGGL